ncbi:hypothetical protein MY10362_001906 [Beauveria mimosiformis]
MKGESDQEDDGESDEQDWEEMSNDNSDTMVTRMWKKGPKFGKKREWPVAGLGWRSELPRALQKAEAGPLRRPYKGAGPRYQRAL